MISARYVPVLCVLVALALVPTIIHSYSQQGLEVDGRTAGAIPLVLAGQPGIPTDRNATWGQRRFNSDDWIEREYRSASGRRLILTVVRTYDAKSVYHHPELAVTYHRATFVKESVQRVGTNSEIPVHVLNSLAGRDGFALYLLHYGERFIDNPIAFQIRTAAELLFTKRKPMTLLFVYDPDGGEHEDVQGSPALTLALAAANALAGTEVTANTATK